MEKSHGEALTQWTMAEMVYEEPAVEVKETGTKLSLGVAPKSVAQRPV